MQNSITQGQIPNTMNMAQMQAQQAPQMQTQCAPQQNYAQAPQITAPAPQPATNPNYAGVNIQIFNPMVGTPEGYVYPQQTNSAYSSGTQGGCYPANYYTSGQYPQGTFVPQNPYANRNASANGTAQGQGYYDQNGVFYPTSENQNGNGILNTANADEKANGANNTTDGNGTENTNADDKDLNNANAANAADGTNATNADNNADANKKTDESANKNSDKNASNDSVNNQNNVNNNNDKNADLKANEADKKDGKKTEKKQIVELTDDYIKTLENYLNSQDTEVRLMGAKEVVNRLSEDSSRKDDPALTALVNKMLQDPSTSIRAIALSLVDSRTVLGDDYTVKVLQKMQNSKDGYGQDATQATSALLKMAGKTVEKEVEVPETPKKDDKKQAE